MIEAWSTPASWEPGSRSLPIRLGGLAWARRSGGRLAAAERRRLMAAIALGQWENVLGRAKLALGRLPAGASEIDVRTFEPPASGSAGEPERAWAGRARGRAGVRRAVGGDHRPLLPDLAVRSRARGAGRKRARSRAVLLRFARARPWHRPTDPG